MIILTAHKRSCPCFIHRNALYPVGLDIYGVCGKYLAVIQAVAQLWSLGHLRAMSIFDHYPADSHRCFILFCSRLLSSLPLFGHVGLPNCHHHRPARVRLEAVSRLTFSFSGLWDGRLISEGRGQAAHHKSALCKSCGIHCQHISIWDVDTKQSCYREPCSYLPSSGARNRSDQEKTPRDDLIGY